MPIDPILALGGLLHDIGKPKTYTKTDRVRFNRHEYVGATIHYLSKGLDSGPVIFHSLVDGSFCNAYNSWTKL